MEKYAFEEFRQNYDAMSEDIKQHCIRIGHYMSRLLVALGKEELNHLWKRGDYSPLYCHTLGHEMQPQIEVIRAEIFHQIYDQQLALKNKELCLFSSLAYDVVTSKYEWWDGSGSPRGDSKEKIPLIGRICAVADQYDVLRTLGCDHEMASCEIERDSGIRFDPQIVEGLDELKDASI